MKRKIIRQANSAYTLTLPIDWVRENKLDKDSEIDVEVEGRSLIVSNGREVADKKIKVDVSGMLTKNIYLHVNSLYASGADEIELVSEKDISSIVTGHLNHLVGYALVSQDDNRYILRDIGGLGHANLDEIFKRVFQAVILFFQSAIKDVFGEQKSTLRCLQARDFEVNKLCLYLQRSINKMSYGDAVRGRALFTYSFELERLSDDILRFWRTNVNERPRKSKELEKLSEYCLELLGLSFDSYYSFKSRDLERLYSLREKIRRGVFNMESHDKMANLILKISEEILDLNQLTIMINCKLE